MNQNNPIKITYRGFDDTEHEAFIYPLKRKEGILVLHKVIAAFASLESGDLKSAFNALDFDTLWDLASRMLRFSTIDGRECKDIEQTDLFNGHFEDLYIVTFKCLEANYPNFFAKMGLGDLTASIPRATADQ